MEHGPLSAIDVVNELLGGLGLGNIVVGGFISFELGHVLERLFGFDVQIIGLVVICLDHITRCSRCRCSQLGHGGCYKTLSVGESLVWVDVDVATVTWAAGATLLWILTSFCTSHSLQRVCLRLGLMSRRYFRLLLFFFFLLCFECLFWRRPFRAWSLESRGEGAAELGGVDWVAGAWKLSSWNSMVCHSSVLISSWSRKSGRHSNYLWLLALYFLRLHDDLLVIDPLFRRYFGDFRDKVRQGSSTSHLRWRFFFARQLCRWLYLL